MLLSLRIACRFLFKSWLQNIILIFVIAVGIGVQLVIFTISDSTKNLITDQAIAYNEHLLVTVRSQRDCDNPDLSLINPSTEIRGMRMDAYFRNYSDEISYAYFMKNANSILETADGRQLPFLLNIYSDEVGLEANGLMVLENTVQSVESDYPYQVTVHNKFLLDNHIEIGAYVTLSHRVNNVSQTFSLQITKSVDLGVYRASFNTAYTTYDAVYEQNPNVFSTQTWMLLFQVKDPNQVESTYNKLINDFPSSTFLVRTWKTLNPEIERLTLAQVAVTTLIQFFVSIAVLIVVVTILGFMIFNKSKQIGILKAMGFSDRKVSFLFLSFSSILGLLSGIVGISGGYFVLKLFERFMRFDDGTPRLLIKYDIGYFILSVIIIFITVLFASFLAIRKAHKQTIIELIKL